MKEATTLEKLTAGVVALGEQNALLEKEASELRDRLESFEKRARAEDVLVMARGTDAPSGLKAVTIEDFLAKRAQLEGSSDGHIDKVAMFVQYLEEADGLMLSDDEDGTGRGDLNEWLHSIA